MTRRSILVLLAMTALLVAVIFVALQFRADMKAARTAVNGYATLEVDTSFGRIELVDQGNGFPVLSIHGTGGGFDQGTALAEALLQNNYRVIAPSRFGYLGTPVPERNDAVAQADAFAEMLDALGIETTVVMGTSAGAITALHFAARHPQRTAALLAMVPAYYPPGQAAPEPWSPLKTWAVTTALQSDFLFWAGLKLFPSRVLATVLATDSGLIEAADAAERTRLHALVGMIVPISARADGLMLDAQNTAAPPVVDLASITVPTFIASAEDDHYRTADSARLLARAITGAELLITPDGGHVWVGRSGEIEAAVAAFLEQALSPP